jgi:hypothetical protein
MAANQFWRYLLVLLLILGMSCAPAPEQPSLHGSSTTVGSLPKCVIDPSTEKLYVANPAGGIDALNQATGQCLWSTGAASVPLALSGGILAAQASAEGPSLKVAVLDVTREGKLLSVSDPVVFPDWVSVPPALGKSFQAEGRIEEGDLLLEWEANSRYARGIPPSGPTGRGRDPEDPFKKDAAGVARISLKTGSVSMLPPDKPLPIPAVRLPKELLHCSVEASLPQRTRDGLVISGDILVGLEIQRTGEPAPPRKQATAKETLSHLLLRRWKLADGEPLEPVELSSGVSFSATLLPREGYILVSPATQEPVPAENCFQVLSLQSGRPVGQFPNLSHLRGRAVVGTRAYAIVEDTRVRGNGPVHTFPRTLKAFDLESARPLWERAIAGSLWIEHPP